MLEAQERIGLESLFTIQGKTALITGGSRGIGLMIAQGFLEAGAKVYISSRKAEACDRAAKELSALGPCISVPADVATPEGRQSLKEAFSVQENRLNILVNNAGTTYGAPIEEYPDAAFNKLMGLNVNAVFAMTRDFLPYLADAGTSDDPSRVINIGSMDGLHVPTVQGVPTFAYSASKAAVHHLTHSLAVDLAPRHITVNAIAPGFFPSKMTQWVFEQHLEDIEERCPLHRVGRPAEMAGIAIYLASRAGAYTNGAVIPVDGGSHIA